MQITFFGLLITFILSCNQNQGGEIAKADKIVSSLSGGYHARVVKRKITVTAEDIKIELEGNKTIKKTYSFTRKDFAILLASFKKLRVEGKAQSDDCLDRGNEHLTFYKDGEEILSADDYHCEEDSRNFTGAKLDLTYLIEDYDQLLATVSEDDDPLENKVNTGWIAMEKSTT